MYRYSEPPGPQWSTRSCKRTGHIPHLLRFVELELIDHERRTVERRIRAARSWLMANTRHAPSAHAENG
jgi:hypothetical protein